ncbi:disease resistance protein RPM1-like [Ipomoea triloba]|uniref:disease resistance protein RPM1-like n=1 Tax=Ipomoea triloba TaxID=35885 RepID=UPI00125D0F91|nr:disease resistance protein RPM1-like [Ipomoea triloba]
MAHAPVMFLLGQLSTLIRDEYSLLGGLREDAEDIRNALDRLTAALRVADEMEEIDPQVQAWVRIVRELAYDTEDVLDEFLFRFGGRQSCGGFYTKIDNTYTSLKNLRARRRLALALRRIKAKVNENSQYQPSLPTTFPGTVHHTHNKRMYDSRGDARLVEESDLVGIHYPKQFLVNLLLANDEELKVHSVVGTGGLGKTTLVKQAYDDAEVINHFQYRVWVTISETFEIKELLKDAIKQFVGQTKQGLPQDFETMSSTRLKEFVKEILSGRRYIIVFDDIWGINAWMEIKCVLSKEAFGSRVVITTRNSEIGAQACHDTRGVLYSLKHLSPEDSWTLFCKKTFLCDSCPQHLVNITTNILNRCCGLPLAIVVIAGVLATKNEDIKEWERFQQSLNIQLVEGNDMMKNMKNILSLSYYDLPYYLKYCFLYLCVFPEDIIIQKKQVIRLWIAEGFVRENNQQVKEEVAEAYLDELLHRNLIQIGRETKSGRVKGFQVHDILREVVLSKSIEQKFATIANGRNIESFNKFRHLAIHRLDDHIMKSTSPKKHLRSLLIMESLSSSTVSFLLSKLLTGSYNPLKVLDLRGTQLEEIPEQVFNLFQLKYLSLRKTKLKSVHKSIGRLQNLETLDLKHTCVVELPNELSKLCKLRHLLVYRYLYKGGRINPWINGGTVQSCNALFKIGELQFLQKLCYIQASDTKDSKVVFEIGKLTQLRRLGVTTLKQEDGKALCSSLKRLTNLCSLHLSSASEDEILDITIDVPLRLHQLKLMGRLESAPQWLSSLVGLTHLFLIWSRLPEDPLPFLQDLPMLARLDLVKSYEGEGLCFNAEKFSKLKCLYISDFEALKWIRMEEGALCHLEEFFLGKCKLLQKVPLGIEHLSNLKTIHIHKLAAKLMITLETNGENCGNYAKLSHIPQIYTSRFIGGKLTIFLNGQEI